MDSKELAIHIRNTEYFINQRPSIITLTPLLRVRKTGGGYEDVPQTPRMPQKFRIIELSIDADDQHLRQSEGDVRREPFWLLGMPDVSVAIEDYWIDGVTGRRWRVAEVIRDNEYETRAVVQESGR